MYHSFILLLAISTFFTIINRKYLKLPATIGIMILGILFSLSILLLQYIDKDVYESLPNMLNKIDFHDFLMNIILGFLLFAGALNINLKALEKEKWSVLLFALLGTLISTIIIGFLSHYIFKWIGFHIPILYCLLFGSLISPTDPIAVLSIFKSFNIDKSISIKVEGESLFNDGIGIVIFISILSIIQGGNMDFGFAEILLLFGREAIGGIAFGLILGMIGKWAMKQTIDDPKTAVMVSLVIVTGGWVIANILEISAALSMVMAGIIIGQWLHNKSSIEIKKLVFTFWGIMDEIFNNTLFVLMGFSIILLDPSVVSFYLAALSIIIVLFARLISVAIPLSLLRSKHTNRKQNKKLLSILTWSGLRGALAFALALSLIDMPYGHQIIFITYVVATFSIIVQGLTIGKLLKHFGM